VADEKTKADLENQKRDKEAILAEFNK